MYNRSLHLVKNHVANNILGHHHWSEDIHVVHSLKSLQIEVGHNVIVCNSCIIYITVNLYLVATKAFEDIMAYVFTISKVNTLEEDVIRALCFQSLEFIGIATSNTIYVVALFE